jgi:hypothetical protein
MKKLVHIRCPRTYKNSNRVLRKNLICEGCNTRPEGNEVLLDKEDNINKWNASEAEMALEFVLGRYKRRYDQSFGYPRA